MKKILIVGSNDRASLVVARSLGMAGYYVGNLRLEEKSPTFYSKFVTSNHYIEKKYNENRDIFLGGLLSLIKEYRYDFILPINDDANEIIYGFLSALSEKCTVLGPSSSSYAIASDKYTMAKLCLQLGIPVPKTRLILKGTYSLPEDIDFPMYLKPIKSSQVSEGFLQKYSVKKVSSLSEFRNFTRDNNGSISILAQEECPGHGVGVNILAHKGVIINYTVHERIHEPKDGGGSSYRKSIALDPELEHYTELICGYLKVTGVLMIEFKKSGDNYYFMEINTRFWGSLELSLNSGVDFPLMMIRMFEGHSVSKSNYRTGRYSRHLLKDFGWFINEFYRTNGKLELMKYWIQTFRRNFQYLESYDDFKTSDLLPFFAQFYIRLSKTIDTIFSRVSACILTQIFSGSIDDYDRILFVCKGNINRSAFAEAFLKSKGYNYVFSCGTLERQSRLVSYQMLEIASELYNIDLSAHRSSFLTDHRFYESDIVICFDMDNYSYVRKRYPRDKHKVYLIGNQRRFCAGIADPHKGSLVEYRSTATLIANNLLGLISKK